MRGIIRNTAFFKCISQICVLFLWMKCLRLLLKEYKYLIKGISTNIFVINCLFFTDNIEHQPKSNKKYIAFYIVSQVLKVLLRKICKIHPLYLLFLEVSSADIIFHKFLALHSKSAKIAVSWKFGYCSASTSLKIWWIITHEH